MNRGLPCNQRVLAHAHSSADGLTGTFPSPCGPAADTQADCVHPSGTCFHTSRLAMPAKHTPAAGVSKGGTVLCHGRPCLYPLTNHRRRIDGADVQNETVTEDVHYECICLAHSSTHRVVEHQFIVITDLGARGMRPNYRARKGSSCVVDQIEVSFRLPSTCGVEISAILYGSDKIPPKRQVIILQLMEIVNRCGRRWSHILCAILIVR